MGVKFGLFNTAIYGKIVLCSFKPFEQYIFGFAFARNAECIFNGNMWSCPSTCSTMYESMFVLQ